jgi:polar amino acid transport system substrate-binding protein
MDSVANLERDCCRKSTQEHCLDNNGGGSMGHTPAKFFRSLFGTVALAVSIALSSLPAVAQSPSQPGPPRDLNSIVEAKVLRVAVTRFDLPSFHVRGADGALLGPEIEMAEQIGRALGVRVEFVDNAESFDSVVDFVAAGRADIGVSKLSQTYNRLKRVRFSEPYVTLRHALLFNRVAIAREAGGRPPAAVLQKYKGRLGVIAGSAYVDFAHRNFPDATVVEAPNWDAAIESLLSGQVDAVYRDEFEIRRVLKNKPALNVRFGSAVIVDQNALLSIAICDTCAKLQEFINYHIGMTLGAFTLKGLLDSQLGKQAR